MSRRAAVPTANAYAFAPLVAYVLKKMLSPQNLYANASKPLLFTISDAPA